MEIYNIAIVAHVDHGKTTLVDALLKANDNFDKHKGLIERAMDSNDQEKERGITIYAKNAAIIHNNKKINIVDTPGHADLGSEVERVLRTVDAVILVIDAYEGPMPQTKFVLKKSLELGLKPIVVLNKIDKLAARPDIVQEMVYELFLDLGASDEQLDFTTIYAVAKQGVAKTNLDDDSKDLTPLLDAILKEVPVASSEDAKNKLLRFQPFNLAYDNFLGRLAIGRIYEGEVKDGFKVIVKDAEGKSREGKITKLFTFEGLKRKGVESAQAGDIVMVAGLPDIFIGETICLEAGQAALPAINIDEPTISLNLSVNSSPFAGREGKNVTNRQLKERLEKELEVNVGLKIDFSAVDHYKIHGRGEMHIAILLENMRREGYEMQISQPRVIIKEENGVKVEPFEEVIINVPEKMSGGVIKTLSSRCGNLLEMKPERGHLKIIFEIPTRGLLGYRNEFIVDTKGEGIIYTRVIGFKPYAGEIKKRSVGSMISMASGKALGFSLFNLQDRGSLYIEANTEVYEGMVIGNTSKGLDMAVNPTKGKQLTNMRASGSDKAINLTPPVKLGLEQGMGIMNKDEYLEITPKSIRLRKQYLTENERVKAARKK